MINPVNHSGNQQDMAIYKAEPYVMAADVYAAEGHSGRGGWTWYTGSSGWAYQLISESLLGISRRGNALSVRPQLPADWSEIKIVYREEKGSTTSGSLAVTALISCGWMANGVTVTK